jgi:hypothetical protein
MMWLTWRQFRVQGAIALAALIAFAVLLAVTGHNLGALSAASRIGTCHGANCVPRANDFLSRVDTQGSYLLVYLLSIAVVLVTPGLIGMFCGAPLLAREFETGTHYLAWNQSITRTRWLVVKLAVVGLGAMVVTQAFSLMLAWWAAPIHTAIALGGYGGDPLIDQNQFSPLVFATRGITPLGYAAFAFALGVTTGFVLRRTVPAMALTLAVYVVFQLAMPLWIRPNLFPPEHTTTTLSAVLPSSGSLSTHTGVSSAPGASLGSPTPGRATFTFTAVYWAGEPEAWIVASAVVDTAGKPVIYVPAACARASSGPIFDCLTSHGVRVAITYQPAGRYWAFQGTETAIYLALALALVGYCFWRLNRRLM